MHIGRIVTYIGAGILGLCMLTPPKARADDWNQKTIFTFQQPVEIPGRVLEPGTYVFKLADSQSDRNIVEVWNKNENHLYGTFLAIPNYRLRPAGRSIITFEERAAGAPEAVRAWFYPGENYGHEFVYPKTRAIALAQANRYSVPAMPNETNTQSQTSMSQSQMSTLKQTPLKSEQPSQQETELGEQYTAPPQQQAQATPPPPPEQPMNNREANRQAPPPAMPHTGSDLPLIALIGALSLGAAGSLRFAAAKAK